MLVGYFCFENDELIKLKLKVKAGNVLEGITGSNLPEIIDGYVSLPTALIDMQMVKTSWGWDRQTTLGPDFLRGNPTLQQAWRGVLPRKYADKLDGMTTTQVFGIKTRAWCAGEFLTHASSLVPFPSEGSTTQSSRSLTATATLSPETTPRTLSG